MFTQFIDTNLIVYIVLIILFGSVYDAITPEKYIP